MSKSRKSGSIIQRLSSYNNVLKKEKSTASNKEKRYSISSYEENLVTNFKQWCFEEDVDVIPNIKILTSEPIYDSFPFSQFSIKLPPKSVSSTNESKSMEKQDIKEKSTEEFMYNSSLDKRALSEAQENIREILILLDHPDYPTFFNSLVVKFIQVDSKLTAVLNKVLTTYSTITTLKLEFCNLNYNDIETLAEIISDHINISDLSLNGNPNPQQNFHLILSSLNLLCLSLKMCSINNTGIANIAEKLTYPNETKLKSLTLSSNKINDEGAERIAHMLRTNRTLVHINLADNEISNSGCIAIMNVFKVFTLQHNEIVLRRKKRIGIIKKKLEMMEELKKSQNDIVRPKSESINRRRSSTDSRKLHKKPSDTQTRKSSKALSAKGSSHSKDNGTLPSKKDSVPLNEILKIKKSIDELFQMDSYPFMTECFSENKEVYCRGNLQVSILNLAYNKISKLGVKSILDTLQHQKFIKTNNETNALSSITLEGNLTNDCSHEIYQIQIILNQKNSRQSLSSKGSGGNSQKRRSSSSRSISKSII